ncbi:EscN/YscN/HrcN family type III secretion system ATPase [Chlamydia trachomatis]|uniref:Type 3 secretion system ATPase n=1 Tax=Chlamydia trachomatis serovar L2 (strain ATCC VR-902B / DSM 19102 / 434/Bu) TaxID=471472 RepID=A0A0H3MG55_CHLT2|nr:SctN family type III secretion system ATPase CdsN [Chlamydia trachomatis]AGJ64122.1 ATP synthase [Chlamydia trachomatis L2/434/Bu(i)]AGJ65062.1 ATP synthase [Chlamydia trachomatis L2/434/Bu(f)]AGR95034.1 type III secretion system ATPase [Chlamydia trachomatis RC-L2(s)/46]AGR97835.1 type III secretion system ATPase [Chlamydia trachomatis RC-J/953]AGR98755.1 type III secretion system ATPase [Chlamydia trachomatis RC-L2(s)/3]
MEEITTEFNTLMTELPDVQLTAVVGRIIEVVGMLIKAVVPDVRVGEVCLVKRHGMEPLVTEVVGFTQNFVFLSPLGELTGVSPSSEVMATGLPLHIRAGEGLLGRVLNGLGNPIDTETKGPLENVDAIYPIFKAPPDPLHRAKLRTILSTGVRCIDGMLTVAKGQRIGIFAGAGVGKSSLLGMIARNAEEADINVIALIGERGREVREFIENDLGEEGMKRSIIVVSTSDQSSQLRLNAAYVGTAIAEYFRDQGKTVVLMMDSVTRFARALREVGLAAGEPPARAGYTPSVFSTLPKLLERAGASDKGTITAFYTVLVAGDDMNEPVADEVKSILDGHIVLSNALAQAYHYPAIDVLASISRLLTAIVPEEQRRIIGRAREVLAKYKANEMLIRIGEYRRGSDREVDFAIDHIDKLNRFLKQDIHEKTNYEEAAQQLRAIFR